MVTVRKLVLACVLLVGLPWSAAHAGGFIGVNIGIPLGHYYHPYYGGYYRPYYGGYYYDYRPYPVYVAPPAVIVQSAPAIETIPVQPVYPAPAVAAPAPPSTIRATSGDTRQNEIDHCLSHLSNPDEKVRADMAIQLGRLRAVRAADTLNNTLATDRSAAVRDSAARALGLIGANASLTALDRAAQADDDRDVRRSAQYAAEVIRANRSR